MASAAWRPKTAEFPVSVNDAFVVIGEGPIKFRANVVVVIVGVVVVVVVIVVVAVVVVVVEIVVVVVVGAHRTRNNR
ncbi:hypothetical protein ElyMa_006408500 [Elysia marginata]|uniref:Transmembrane protein n=1 Tax=Elysia marginata TaxID=1093978 RepID=A0AAV4HUJ0_9GAST|nr:hypothetical protein ElyMa_006408500 [Elysia marginata]